jgi:transposase
MDWKKLLGSITKSVDEELRLRNAYLMTENRILRQQSTGRVPLTDSDRQALAEIGIQLGKRVLQEIATVAKPDTILAWHRKFASPPGYISQLPKSVGRPRIDQEVEDVVVRMARENRSWGYDRIVGALANLGYTISDQTVGNILKRHGIPPAPQRKKTVTWREFIQIHVDVLGATDFFSSEIWAWFTFVLSWVLSFRLPDCCLRHVASMKSYLHQWRMLVVPLWSLNMRPRRGSWRGVVKEGARAGWVLCGPRILRQPSSESVSYNYPGVLPQGMGRVVSLPVVRPYAIRDGPIPHRQWPGGLLPYANCKAA